MVHGLPDWGLVGPRQQTYGLDDVGEAAVRLGSPISYDRRGDVICYDDWDNGLNHVQPLTVGLGASVDLTPDYAIHGPFCVRLTAGSTLTRAALVQCYVPLRYDSVLGLETWFTVEPNLDELHFYLIRDIGGTRYVAEIRLSIPLGTLAYMDALGNYITIIGGLVFDNELYHYHVLKLVGDFTTHEYVRVQLDGVTHLLLTLPMFTGGGHMDARLLYGMTIYGLPATNAVSKIGLFVVTQNEPT